MECLHEIMPLHHACRHRSPAILRFLLGTKRFNVNRVAETSGPAALTTPLHSAAHSRFVEGCIMLLSAGACTKNVNANGLSPLMYALVPSKFDDQLEDVEELRLVIARLFVDHDPSSY